MAAEWRAEQARCQREIDRHQEADKSYMDEGVQILELARNAKRLFERQEPRQKRRLLNYVLSNCSWEDGEVIATFRQPFDLLAETTAIAAQAARDERRSLTKSEIWLPGRIRTSDQPVISRRAAPFAPPPSEFGVRRRSILRKRLCDRASILMTRKEMGHERLRKE
jgi:hypothetical protein